MRRETEMNNKALQQFVAAMSEYAEQLAKHTDVVKGIASASQCYWALCAR